MPTPERTQLLIESIIFKSDLNEAMILLSRAKKTFEASELLKADKAHADLAEAINDLARAIITFAIANEKE